MSINIYEPITNPVTKETFRCISSTADSYRMEWIVAPTGYVAFEHIHCAQDEVFYVKKGRLKLVLEGRESILNAGDTAIVPMGSRHIAENGGDEVLECEVEYNPGLDFYTFSQCVMGLIKDGEYDKKGQTSIAKIGYFMYKTKCKALARPTNIPGFMLTFAINFFGIVGTIAGWNRQLERYIGEAGQAVS